ncbi:MAG TPA: hypothetical protein VHE36_05610 [Sphingomicrobium sp.]|nr:hypothetical protein [Sphingomicrobium sp.]
MRKTLMLAAAGASLIGLSACNKQASVGGNESTQTASSADAINGTWKADISSVQWETKPDEYLLRDGTFSCKSCTPPYSVAADGAFHPVNTPYFDSDSVKIVDARTITETSKKGDRVIAVYRTTVSADGNTQTTQFTDTSTPGEPSKGEFSETRVGPAPAGAHAISGQWKPSKLANFNDAALTFTVDVNGDTYKSSSPDGTSYEAKIGGGDVPINGDIAGTLVSVARSGDNGYVVTRKRDGKVVGVVNFTVGADGRLKGVSENKQNGSIMRWSADKQS